MILKEGKYKLRRNGSIHGRAGRRRKGGSGGRGPLVISRGGTLQRRGTEPSQKIVGFWEGISTRDWERLKATERECFKRN